jgi:hypothetical protein
MESTQKSYLADLHWNWKFYIKQLTDTGQVTESHSSDLYDRTIPIFSGDGVGELYQLNLKGLVRELPNICT